MRSADGPVVAVTYVMGEDDLALPSPAYLRTIAEGYEAWGLPLAPLEDAAGDAYRRIAELGARRLVRDGPKRLRPVTRPS